jgi:hypothetical protein
MFRLIRAIIRALYLQNTNILMVISPNYIHYMYFGLMAIKILVFCKYKALMMALMSRNM